MNTKRVSLIPKRRQEYRCSGKKNKTESDWYEEISCRYEQVLRRLLNQNNWWSRLTVLLSEWGLDTLLNTDYAYESQSWSNNTSICIQVLREATQIRDSLREESNQSTDQREEREQDVVSSSSLLVTQVRDEHQETQLTAETTIEITKNPKNMKIKVHKKSSLLHWRKIEGLGRKTDTKVATTINSYVSWDNMRSWCKSQQNRLETEGISHLWESTVKNPWISKIFLSSRRTRDFL
jgi:hypothetical protein